MGMPEVCQHRDRKMQINCKPDGSLDDMYDYWTSCGGDSSKTPVHYYRTCGAGCKHVIAYCGKHGGDERAKIEMQAHIEEKHAHGS